LFLDKTSSKSDVRLFPRIAALAKPCWPQLAGITLLSLLSAPLALLGPLPLKIAVDTVIGEQSMPKWIHMWAPLSWQSSKASSLMFAAGLLMAIALLGSVQSLLSWLLQTYTGERLVHDFRAQLLWHAQRLSLAFHDRRGANDTAFRIQYDAPAIQTLVLQGIIPLSTAVFGFVAVLFVTMQISPKLAAISLIVSPVLYVLARNSSKKVRRGYDEIRELDSSAMLVLTEALSAVRSVKAFGQESHQDELFRRKSRLRMKEQIRLASVQALFHVLIGLSIAGGTAVALVIGITQVRQNLITVGELLLVMAYMAQLYEPLRTISTKIPELQSSLSSLARAVAILDELPEITESEKSIPIKRVDGNVSMRNVGFQYSAGTRRVLQDISFEIPAGACVGIIGASGSGKSTLINLITRFYDPVEGQVFLDGVDLREYDLRDLRRQFSIVLQEPMLFSTTVAGNIAYGNLNATRDEVVDAAKLANAHEFIEQMSEGYNTLIGEKGVRLSGGERQRIAIARAFLKNAPVVILDEPTSAVDVKTEASIMQGIQNLAFGRTTFMIAHRLSTLERCDMVLVMKDGRLNLVTNQVDEARRELIESSRPQVVPFGPQGPQLIR
jgi:ATP-binding cassette, subfamily B, bacterial